MSHAPTTPRRPFRNAHWKGDIAERGTRTYTRHYATEDAARADAARLTADGRHVHLEAWDESHDQGPLNEGWALYDHAQPTAAPVADPVHAAAEEAGLGVMGHVLDVVRDAEEVSADFLATLTADDIAELYERFIGRAILRMEDALKVREAEGAPARAALAALEAAATQHDVRMGENTAPTDYPSWLVERAGDGVLGAVGYDRGDYVAETEDDTTTHTTAAAAVAAVVAA